jgi:hypothetical protein
LERDGVLVEVVAGVCGAGWGAKEVRVEVHLIVGRDDRGLVDELM